jgi:hypothetical protein
MLSINLSLIFFGYDCGRVCALDKLGTVHRSLRSRCCGKWRRHLKHSSKKGSSVFMSFSSASVDVQMIVSDTGSRGTRHLIHPYIDFFCLGGLSLLFLGAFFLIPTHGITAAEALLYSGIIAHVINAPHFAHSYHLFYRNFSQKISASSDAPSLRWRYVFAGIVVPIVLVGFFAFCVLQADTILLGYAVNAMFFFVGWHYVKQGYGILIVESVLKKTFLTLFEKRVMLVNAYVCWIFFWLWVNTNVEVVFHQFWGISYSMFTLPPEYNDVLTLVAIISTGLMINVLCLRLCRKGWNGLPWTGVVAYLASIYVWILPYSFDPVYFYFIPVFHSLQYLPVVWRFEINRNQGVKGPSDRHGLQRLMPMLSAQQAHLITFIAIGCVAGYAMFWGVPQLLDRMVPYNQTIFPTTLFLFLSWIFINVHHYFLDNVMWRRENTEVKQYLFG